MATEAVFVDLDNTLYPYPPCNVAGKQAAWETACDIGYESTREAFDERYMEARREVKRELAGTASAHERFLYFKRFIEIAADSQSARDALALGEAYWETYVDTMDLFDGVIDTFDALRDRGLEIAIVSNLTTRIQLEKIDRLGIGEYVDLVLTSEETGREKPSSIMFTQPLAQLDLRPSEVVMVGDSVESDVEGGNAVGLTTVLCNNDETGLTGREQPDHRIDTFADLPGVMA